MSGDLTNLRRRLQELEELHATGFVDAAQYAESKALLERWIVDAVMKEEAEPDPPSQADAGAPITADPGAPVKPRSAHRWLPWLGAAAAIHALGIGFYWWSTWSVSTMPPVMASKAGPTSSGVVEKASAPAPAAPVRDLPAETASASAPSPSNVVPPVGPASIRGTVALSPALRQRARPDDPVFIYARAVDGPPMPLAVMRKRVKDLPVPFTFDDSMAVWPAARVSAFPLVIVTARVSKSGEGKPRPGDLEGHSAPVAAGAAGLQVEISTVVPN